MNFCLSDLVPPLRWSDAAEIPLLREQPGLPDAWWRSLPLSRVLAVLPPAALAEMLAEIALAHWPAAAVGDVLPALYVLDPDEADEPCTAIALDRAGSWPGMLSLTGHDLRDQPFLQARPLLHALFSAVFAHLAPDPASAAPAFGLGAPALAEARGEVTPAITPVAAAAGKADGTAEPETPQARLPETDREAEAPREPGTVQEPATAGRLPGTEREAEAAREPEAPQEPEAAQEPETTPEPETAQEPETTSEPETAQEPETTRGDEPVRDSEDLHALLDGVFAGLEDTSWAVAQNRVFSDEPATVDALAKLFAVQPEAIRDIEAELRRRLREWLASDEAAPYREHLAGLRAVLGKAAPRNRLIGAADWHAFELRSLDVPAWQFVLATLSDYYLVDGWLVDGDIADLQHRTRDLISGAERPTVGRALELISSLGIHPEVAKEWLENVPQLRILGANDPAPPHRGNGTTAAQTTALAGRPVQEPAPEPIRKSIWEPAGQPVREPAERGADGEPEPARSPFRPLKDVALTRRCFRQPDGRWWLRIDVTAEHIEGAECPLPTGFASYLGMSPGSSRTVSSAVGELMLSWQDRPVLDSLGPLLRDAGAKEGSHLFLTLSDEGVLRARHLPAAGSGVEPAVRALRLVGYTAPCETPEHAARVIATRVGMSGPVILPDLLTRLRERGDRDLQSLLA
ncbi:hypothetical protein HS041_37825 [Planomonospora sp. ID67723]|uniref:hypothetical protein n=1 Tax=Planomonospora sp. ID67723 TaxID=2738134 RepID=UPI0018C354DC|nr:hypothetical protein [Planomonospora sp. ID67723]MBG0833464.1 hypothetical protein [Planomonospora sp. ID67723]